jgi:hypothetical protein
MESARNEIPFSDGAQGVSGVQMIDGNPSESGIKFEHRRDYEQERFTWDRSTADGATHGTTQE